MAQTLSRSALLALARAGALARIGELRQEIETIHQAFPDLKATRGRQIAVSAGNPSRRKPGLRRWSAAQRKAAADRMKKYWAARKGGKP